MTNPNQSELELINMVQEMFKLQHTFFDEKKKYGSAPTALRESINYENKLKAHMKKRKDEILSLQQSLF